MPPKAKPSTTIKKVAGGKTAAAKPAAKPAAKKAPVPASKKGDSKTAVNKSDSKPAAKQWTKEDDAARKIQTVARGFLSRRALQRLKTEKQEYDALMDKLEQEACIAIAKQHQLEAEEQARKEMEERKRKADEKKRVKRMLEAAFDGEIDEINAILKEVRELDNKNNVGHDLVGEAKRMRHLMNVIECEDAHGTTPLSEASSGGHVETVRYLIELGADPNSRGQFNRTPLYRASFAGHIDCVETLLENGGDPRLYAEDGQTPENVSSIDAVKEAFSGWDVTQTDKLLTKIESEKEKRKEQERARREAEQSELDRQLADAQKEYNAHQKTLNSIYCELNKRIDEHDTAPAMGFQKPEITLQAIRDSEDQLEIAKIDYEASKEKIRKLKMLMQQHKKEEIAAEGYQLPGLAVTIRELPDILFRDVGNKIKESGKWPLVIDTSNQAATYLRYQDTNYLNALAPKDMETEKIRLAIIGAIRFGKPVVLDMMEVDMFETVSDRMDQLLAGLMGMIMDKSIMQEENFNMDNGADLVGSGCIDLRTESVPLSMLKRVKVYLKLVKAEDGDLYLKQNFSPYRTQNFKIILLTKNIFPSEKLMEQTFIIRIIIPEKLRRTNEKRSPGKDMSETLISPSQKLSSMMRNSKETVRVTRHSIKALASCVAGEPLTKKACKESSENNSLVISLNPLSSSDQTKPQTVVSSSKILATNGICKNTQRLRKNMKSQTKLSGALVVQNSARKRRRSAAKLVTYKESRTSDEESAESEDRGDTDSDVELSQLVAKKRNTRKPDLSKGKRSISAAVKKAVVTPKAERETKNVTMDSMNDNTVTEFNSHQPDTYSKSKICSNEEISSDESGDDWEEVADLAPEILPNKPIQITVDAPAGKKKKKFSWLEYSKMLWRRYQKSNHECVHKVELLCLFAHGKFVNDACNDNLLKALAMSIYGKITLKGKQCTLANVENALCILKERISLDSIPPDQIYLNTDTLMDRLAQGMNSGALTRQDEFVVLVVGVLRALGASVRLCMAWYPIPFRITHFQKQQEVNLPKPSKSIANKAVQSKRSKTKGNKTYPENDLNKVYDKQTWLEVYTASEQSWLTVDGSGSVVKDVKVIEENLRKPITYIVCYDNVGKFKDLTQKYVGDWLVSTKKLRVSDQWWEETITPYHVKESKKTKQEDNEIMARLEKMPLPNTIGGFKDHPLYVLERHLLKFEAIYPSTAVPLGYTKTKEPVYSRSCVVTLHSRETWLKEALQIKFGEVAYKYVKPRPRMSDIKNGIKITEATLPVYGHWQTEPFKPPTAENGKVPRNAYGNVELFKSEMLPIGCVHIPDDNIGRLARKLDIDCAQAMIGWEIHSGYNCPMFDGWVVCKEYKEVLMAALTEYTAELEQKARDKQEKKIYGNWKKLIKGLLIRERLRNRYGKDSF